MKAESAIVKERVCDVTKIPITAVTKIVITDDN